MTRNTVNTVTSQWSLHALSPRVQWPGLEADHLAAFSTNIINKKSYNISPLPHYFHNVNRDNLTFTFMQINLIGRSII